MAAEPRPNTESAGAIRAQGGEARAVEVDVRQVDSVQRLVEASVASYRRVDVLNHNAVDARFVNEQDARLTELSEDTWHQIVELVLTGAFHCCKYVGPRPRRGEQVIIESHAVDLIRGQNLERIYVA